MFPYYFFVVTDSGNDQESEEEICNQAKGLNYYPHFNLFFFAIAIRLVSSILDFPEFLALHLVPHCVYLYRDEQTLKGMRAIISKVW